MAHVDVYLKTEAAGDGRRQMPNLLHLKLGEEEFELMHHAKWVYDFSRTKMHHRSREDVLREIALEFTAGDYRVQSPGDPEKHAQWDGVLEEWLMHVGQQGFRFGALYVGKDGSVRLRSDCLSFEEYENVRRDFRAAQMAERLESAMSDGDAPAPAKSSGMSPI